MKNNIKFYAISMVIAAASLFSGDAQAHKLRESGKSVSINGSAVSVTPSRDWNRLSQQIGKNTETWTLDGTQLNDLTFFVGIEPGMPLMKERSKKREPLPKFTATTLLIEIPELLEGTHRAYKGIGAFEVVSIQPQPFLGNDGVNFAYKYVDADELTRMGEATAVIIDKKLYLFAFDAPRLNYYENVIDEYRALIKSASLSKL